MDANTMSILLVIGLAILFIFIRWAAHTVVNKGADAIQHKINEKQNAKATNETTNLADRYKKAEAQPTESAQDALRAVRQSKRFCANCGAELEADAKFCMKCGQKVE